MENDMQNDTTERSATAKKSLLDGWNAPPNLVTYSRIVLVVIFLGLYIAAGSWGENNIPMRWAAAVLFIVAASTDKVDGWMARKYNQVTELGKLMDPMLLGSILVTTIAPQLSVPMMILLYVYLIAVIIDVAVMWRKLKKKLIEKYGEASVAKGSRSASYAWSRAIQVRRWRLPKPRSPKRGNWPK